jgi:hypothetical protein
MIIMENKNIYHHYNKPVKLFLVLLVLTAVSCKDLLEVTPKSLYVAGEYFKTIPQAQLAVTGIYDCLLGKYQGTYYTTMSMEYDLDNDVTYYNKGGITDGTRQICHYAWFPENSEFQYTWIRIYQALDRANWVIASIPQVDLYKNGTTAEKSQLNDLLGQALFLRALFSFDLIRCFGDVPYKTMPTDASDDMYVEKTNRELIYDQIEADLRQAISLFPDGLTTNTELANDGGSRGLLVRILMYRAGYSLRANGQMERPTNYKDFLKKAASEAKAMVTLGYWGLTSDYTQIFKNYGAEVLNPKECLYEIAMNDAGGGNDDCGQISQWNSPLIDAASKYGRTQAVVGLNPTFKNEFETGDLRKDVSIAEWTIDKNNLIVPRTTSNLYKFSGKFRRDWNYPLGPLEINYTSVNWCLIRYAEVLLFLAEAVNEVRTELPVGVTLQDGIAAINLVRSRAGLPALATSVTGDQEAFRQAIRKERKIELSAESWRKWDLLRWNILGSTLRAELEKLKTLYPQSTEPFNKSGFYGDIYFEAGKDELYPIPSNAIINNPKLKKNPGW